MVGDVDGELDDVTAVLAGVGVIRLDHVSEQEGRPSIGGRELEHMTETVGPFLREDPCQKQ